jgi:hypothetical protein
MSTERFRLRQGGLIVVSVDAPTLEAAERIISSYYIQYIQDGPTVVERMVDKRWKPYEFKGKD